jgi:hypothetical protein
MIEHSNPKPTHPASFPSYRSLLHPDANFETNWFLTTTLTSCCCVCLFFILFFSFVSFFSFVWISLSTRGGGFLRSPFLLHGLMFRKPKSHPLRHFNVPSRAIFLWDKIATKPNPIKHASERREQK